MSAFRESLLNRLKAKNVGLRSEAPGSVEAVFSDLKTEFGLNDQQLMQQVCFYSCVQNMLPGDDMPTHEEVVLDGGYRQAELVSEKNSTLLRAPQLNC